jgi:hypothetical protein
VRRSHKIGKKISLEDVVRKAEESGFNDLTGTDDRTVIREILLYSSGLYKIQIGIW